MSASTYLLFYVNEPQRSAEWYAQLLQTAPLEASPGFALFALADGTRLGLWKQDAVLPASQQTAGATELCLMLDSQAAVSTEFARWQTLNLPVLQMPQDMDFGFTCVTADPDGHRIRIFHPAA